MGRRNEDPTPLDIHLLREAVADLRAGRGADAAEALRVAQEIQEAAEKHPPTRPDDQT